MYDLELQHKTLLYFIYNIFPRCQEFIPWFHSYCLMSHIKRVHPLNLPFYWSSFSLQYAYRSKIHLKELISKVLPLRCPIIVSPSRGLAYGSSTRHIFFLCSWDQFLKTDHNIGARGIVSPHHDTDWSILPGSSSTIYPREDIRKTCDLVIPGLVLGPMGYGRWILSI